MKKIILISMLLFNVAAIAQQSALSGSLYNKSGEPLMYATAVLLYPQDSTMAYYGITNAQGRFEIKNIKAGNYVLQAAYVGFQPLYKDLTLPLKDGNTLGALIMNEVSLNLSEVQIKGDRIPFVIKKDTIEYAAGAYNVKPDAAAEELLKKLPGVQVDRAGNIKAQGENVQNVLVDGKEFFGSDPQVATKNLPADAIEKVQVYNKKSDETELTGIEDGSYAKTINLILKDDMKSAIFGDVTAGGGTDETYQVGAKLYRFTRKHQFAALAMLNNVNKYGFSFRDYLDFNGGLQSLMNGGGGSGQLSIGGDNDLPINFGQDINGLVTSGTGGANFTYEAKKNNRFNISYLGNGADKKLRQNTLTQNYLETGSFLKNDTLHQNTTNRAHRLNFGWRNRIDSTQNLNINGGLSYTSGGANGHLLSESYEKLILMNNLSSISKDDADDYSANISASYLKKWKSNWKLFKIKGNFFFKNGNSNKHWINSTNYFNPPDSSINNGFQRNKTQLINYSGSTSVTRKIAPLWYLVPSVDAGFVDESIDRIQGIPPGEEHLIDSLSPDFTKRYSSIKAGFSINRNTKKSQLNFAAKVESSMLSSSLDSGITVNTNKFYLIPRISWHYEYRSGRQLAIYLQSSVNAPTASQLLPTVNNINPLNLYKGDMYLKPEYAHSLQLNWIFYDQFSLTSIFASLNATYTQDKINWSRTILPNLSQTQTLINVDDDYRVDGRIDFSTPIRKLGVDFKVNLNETWNQGINLVNGETNTNTNFIHTLTLSFNNRKNDKLDVNIGGTLQITDANYTVQSSLNKTYYNVLGFADIAYAPNDKWYFGLTADITRYDAQSFAQEISVPILKAEFTRYFLKNNRGVLTFEISDILDKNKGIVRSSEMNYLMEQQSNTIGRYAMLTFKYRLNKFDNKSGLDIKLNKR